MNLCLEKSHLHGGRHIALKKMRWHASIGHDNPNLQGSLKFIANLGAALLKVLNNSSDCWLSAIFSLQFVPSWNWRENSDLLLKPVAEAARVSERLSFHTNSKTKKNPSL